MRERFGSSIPAIVSPPAGDLQRRNLIKCARDKLRTVDPRGLEFPIRRTPGMAGADRLC
jgi:hypothetical protein